MQNPPTHAYGHTFGLTLAASSNAYTHSLTPLLVSIADHLTWYPLVKQFPARTLTWRLSTVVRPIRLSHASAEKPLSSPRCQSNTVNRMQTTCRCILSCVNRVSSLRRRSEMPLWHPQLLPADSRQPVLNITPVNERSKASGVSGGEKGIARGIYCLQQLVTIPKSNMLQL